MKICLLAGALALVLSASGALAQSSIPQVKDRFGRLVDGGASMAVDKNGNAIDITNPLPVSGRQELLTLITANAPAAPVAVYGGTYVYSQGCTAYGSLTLRYRGPDGVTMITMVTKTASDNAGGTLLSLGTNAIVDVAISGTTGCNATLARIPS